LGNPPNHIGCLFSVCHLMPKAHISCHPIPLASSANQWFMPEVIRIDKPAGHRVAALPFLQHALAGGL
jgi:hypothetical protein